MNKPKTATKQTIINAKSLQYALNPYRASKRAKKTLVFKDIIENYFKKSYDIYVR